MIWTTARCQNPVLARPGIGPDEGAERFDADFEERSQANNERPIDTAVASDLSRDNVVEHAPRTSGPGESRTPGNWVRPRSSGSHRVTKDLANVRVYAIRHERGDGPRRVVFAGVSGALQIIQDLLVDIPEVLALDKVSDRRLRVPAMGIPSELAADCPQQAACDRPRTHLVFDFTFEDPGAFTKPWSARATFRPAPDGTMTESVFTISDELRFRERFLQQKAAIQR